ncbi:RTA1 domain protein [Dacryopinax primogenitus]|uniref:RTA1 domain protein n=1 Tax=Dacryopinax primogenitus (strain DJM 731) TaxID=1858805 RepID=M5FS38_DACPD|nr:RTA1 domain protein [Dacryopinax primogenitus]EJT98598.1 RTA1 domain protein [Dacryopinax primogenitus]
MSSSGSDLPDGYALGSWWYYAPNKGAPIAFALFFAISGVWHIVQCVRFHSWRATGFLPWAALLFVAGFILRAIGAWNYTNLPLFISSTVMLLCAPPIYEAANFFTLGRILYYVPYHSPIHPGRVVITFGVLQAVVEALNGNGGSRVANSSASPQEQNVGKAILKAALILQLACMGAFALLAGVFERRCYKAGLLPKNLRNVLRVLYVSCILITTRTVYRTVEYFEDATISYTDPTSFPDVLKHEWYFWVFEATLMCLNTWMLNIFHPSRFLPHNLKVYLAPDGVTEIEGQGFQDKRNFFITILDPFDIYGLIKGRHRNATVWEEQPKEQPNANNMELGAMDKDQIRTTDSITPLKGN